MYKDIFKISYPAVKNDWDLLHKFLKLKSNPRYIIVGDVDLFRSKDIPNLGNLVGVEGDLDLTRSSIQTLGNLEFVSGDLDLFGCINIKTLGKLKHVGGRLSLNSSGIESLGELEYVGNDIYLNFKIANKYPSELDKVVVFGSVFE
jgi:hypothetical protein